jgi:L-lactate dehydrogenase complex protein LldG
VAVSWPRDERGRALLAERLFLLVPKDQLVPTLDDALERIEALVRDGRPYVTLMTGPSRTADIERALTVGVHGPRELHVVLVG